MVKKTKLFWDANKFAIEMPINYFKFSTRAELIFDFAIPAIITLLILSIVGFIEPSTSTVLKGIKDINNQTLTFISILAGFNVTSISVLATAGSNLLVELKKTKSEKIPDKTLFEIMMTYFCAAIVTQFFIILIGVILLVLSSLTNMPISLEINSYLWILIGFWIFALILTILISIRNLKTLFYIMVNEEY